MHHNINDNHNIIIQYSLSMASISLLVAFTPIIIAKFATNAHILSPLNISFITINIISTEIYSHYKYKNIECQMIKNRSFYEIVIFIFFV